MQLKPRPIVFAALALLAGIFAIAGTATAVYTIKTTSGAFELKGTVTLWRMCVSVSQNGVTQKTCADIDDNLSNDCGALDRWKAMRAFTILSILVALVIAIPIAVLDLLHVLMPSHARRIALASVAGVTVFLSMVSWAIWINTWERECNGTKPSDVEGAKWGPMAPLMLIVSVFGLAMGVVALIVPGAVDEDAAAAGADGAEMQQYPPQQHPGQYPQAQVADGQQQYAYPPQQGYPPQQQYGYPPQQQGYGYPPQQQGYGYPPQQQQPQYGYAPHQQQPQYGYPPQQQQQAAAGTNDDYPQKPAQQ